MENIDFTLIMLYNQPIKLMNQHDLLLDHADRGGKTDEDQRTDRSGYQRGGCQV